jgi:hypothetical protein
MNIWLYVIRQMELAIEDCDGGARDAHAWDAAVALYTGSLEGEDGLGNGKLLYNLADTECNMFKTCGENGGEIHRHAKVNDDIFKQFQLGKEELMKGNCESARRAKQQIERTMAIPLVQGTLRFAYLSDRVQGDDNELNAAKGATFAAAVLPLVHHCSQSSASTIYDIMRVGGDLTDYPVVRKALQQVYSCMGITCEDVGGFWNATANEYYDGAEPCMTSDNNHRLGTILGITFGALFAATFAAIYFYRRRHRKENDATDLSFDTKDTVVVT